MRRDDVSLTDMLNAARRAASYVKGMTRDAFLLDDRTKAAVVREMEIMGEAATRTSQAYRDSHPTIPWTTLTRIRNFYIHVYDAVDYSLVWRSLRQLVPTVEAAAAVILAADETKDAE
jgi:uncharacterized protein with HEPN domain